MDLSSMVEVLGKKWIPSKAFHEEYKPTQRLSETNRAIREMPAYCKLLEDGHILEADSKSAKSLESAEMALLVKSNGYQPVLLVDPVAQKEIEHHFKISVNQAVQSSKENAVLGMYGINVEALAANPKTLALIQAISQIEVLEMEQRKLKDEQMEQRLQLLEMKRVQDNLMLTQGEAQFFTILGYASSKGKRVNVTQAKVIGKAASKLCKDENIQTGEVPDQRFGRVKTYPVEVLDQAFEEYFEEDTQAVL